MDMYDMQQLFLVEKINLIGQYFDSNNFIF